ncbi:hypothetical protein Pelo_5477 [Pelomyxa schiedti]|nr:hypothetical protein Pelo_5477 [Pelomyxa schiedti]
MQDIHLTDQALPLVDSLLFQSSESSSSAGTPESASSLEPWNVPVLTVWASNNDEFVKSLLQLDTAPKSWTNTLTRLSNRPAQPEDKGRATLSLSSATTPGDHWTMFSPPDNFIFSGKNEKRGNVRHETIVIACTSSASTEQIMANYLVLMCGEDIPTSHKPSPPTSSPTPTPTPTQSPPMVGSSSTATSGNSTTKANNHPVWSPYRLPQLQPQPAPQGTTNTTPHPTTIMLQTQTPTPTQTPLDMGGHNNSKHQPKEDFVCTPMVMGGHNNSEQRPKENLVKDSIRISQLEAECATLREKVSSLTAQNAVSQAEVLHWKKENLNLQGRVQSLTDEIQKEMKTVEKMLSLIPADISDFMLEKFLGTGASAAAFKVQFSNCPSSSSGTTTATTSNKTRIATTQSSESKSSMVMKVLFNWESTPRHTRLRQKYMTECVILSSIPPHPNVIHPLGALVIPRMPDEFIEEIPASQPMFREMALSKSLAFIMPFGGIPLSSFLHSLPPLVLEWTWDATVNLFQQALKAVNHIETNKVIHRDIKEDNLLVDPETNTLSLIDFGEATRCLKPDLEVTVSSEMQLWGNTGTMPPELSALLRTLRATGPTVFSYSKCDSFALAVAFWDALLPPQHKFIGSTLNANMAAFTPAKLAASFPDPLTFFTVIPPPATSTSPPPHRTATSIIMKEVMVGMMSPDKHTRMSCSDAIQRLQH